MSIHFFESDRTKLPNVEIIENRFYHFMMSLDHNQLNNTHTDISEIFIMNVPQ